LYVHNSTEEVEMGMLSMKWSF